MVVGKYAGDVVAVKILKDQNADQQAAFLKEAQILKACRSPYVVLLIGVVIPRQEIAVAGIMESPSIMLVKKLFI